MQWFLKEQVEEVASMTTLLTIVDRAGDNLFDIEDFVAREMNSPRGRHDIGRPANSTRRRHWLRHQLGILGDLIREYFPQ